MLGTLRLGHFAGLKKRHLPWQNPFTAFRCGVCGSSKGHFVTSGVSMGKAVLSLAVLLSLSSSVWTNAQEVSAQVRPASAIMPLAQIHEGMKGTALTVFQGVKPESMDVEVLGVMHNVNGPKGDIILVRLHGTKPEYTGVGAGMSGSPVYFDGKLAGALAFRIGEFSKEPIAGVTPIERMLEIDAQDQRPAPGPTSANSAEPSVPSRTAGPGENVSLPLSAQSYSNYLKPIETP